MKWEDVGCSGLHERGISFDLSYDTAALVLESSSLSVGLFLEEHYTMSDSEHNNSNIAGENFSTRYQCYQQYRGRNR